MKEVVILMKNRKKAFGRFGTEVVNNEEEFISEKGEKGSAP